MTGVTRGEGTERGEEGKGEGGGEGYEIIADGGAGAHMDRSNVAQEVLVDLKILQELAENRKGVCRGLMWVREGDKGG